MKESDGRRSEPSHVGTVSLSVRRSGRSLVARSTIRATSVCGSVRPGAHSQESGYSCILYIELHIHMSAVLCVWTFHPQASVLPVRNGRLPATYTYSS